MSIIETLGEQSQHEQSEDRVCAHDVLQMTCPKGIARRIINKHEMHVDAFAS